MRDVKEREKKEQEEQNQPTKVFEVFFFDNPDNYPPSVVSAIIHAFTHL